MRKTFIWVTLILAVAMGGSAQVTEFPIPTSNSGPLGITRGPDGNVWFTENGAKKIGRISMTGTVTEFPLPLPFSDPRGITAGPDGNLWFTGIFQSNIDRMTPSGVLTEFGLTACLPQPLTAGPGRESLVHGNNCKQDWKNHHERSDHGVCDPDCKH